MVSRASQFFSNFWYRLVNRPARTPSPSPAPAPSPSPATIASYFALQPVALACLLASGYGWAQTPAAPLASNLPPPSVTSTLDTVVVTGARAEREVGDVPQRIDVIEGAALDPTRAQDIRELVRDLPNVEVRRAPQRFGAVLGSTGRDGNAGFNIRGLQGNRVLLTVDGMRMPRELVAGVLGSAAFGRDYYDLGLISRVEVVRGATSALYGSDGLGGMVAMFTLQPEQLLQPGQSFGGRLSLRADTEDDSQGVGLTLAAVASPQWQWLGSVQTGRAGALDNQGTNEAANSTRTAPNPQRDRNHSLLGKLVFTPGGGQSHTFTAEHIDKSTDVQALSARGVNPATPGATRDLQGKMESSRTRLSWDGQIPLRSAWADQLRASVGVQQAEKREVATEQRTPSGANLATFRVRDVIYWEDILQLSLQAERSRELGHGWAHKLVYGVELARTEMENLSTGVAPPAGETFPLQRFPTTRDTTSALFIQSEFISERWSLIPALRYDRFDIDAQESPLFQRPLADLSGDALSPKLGLIFRPQAHWQIFGNVAAGFRAPSPLQLNNFFENLVGTAPYRTIPNPNLRPERSQTVELGARGQHGAVQWQATAFSGRYRDFIEDQVAVGGRGTVADPLTFQSINRGRVRLSGFELDGRWALSPATTLRASYGQTEGRDTVLNQPLNSVNPERLVLGLEHRVQQWTLGARLTHTAAKDQADIQNTLTGGAVQFATPSWTTLDLSTSWQITRSTRLSAALNNLTDRKYWHWGNVQGLAGNSAVLDAFTSPGRSLSLSLVSSF